MKRGLMTAAAIGMLATAPAMAEDPMMVEVKRLSMDTALKVARSAIAACRAQGIQVGVTVVDRDGIPQAALRDTIAPTITLPISEGKAYAAVMFNVATSELGARANSPIGRVPGVVMAAGGLPIQVAGALVGGVGVSGAPSGETDQACAQTAVDAIQMDLEMAM
jgi:uncharacterized protein GlcG (DUF336 family)